MAQTYSISLGQRLAEQLNEHMRSQRITRNRWIKEAVEEKLHREFAQIDIADKEVK